MSEAIEREALAILQRLEPVLGRIEEKLSRVEGRLTQIEDRIARTETRIDILLPTLATAEQVSKLAYDLTWRFLSLLGVVLVAYLGAVWFVVNLTLRGHFP